MKTKIKFLAMMLMGIMLSTNVWGADSYVFKQLTADPSDWNGTYLIVSGSNALQGSNPSDANQIDVTDVDGEITLTSLNDAFEIAYVNGSGYSVMGIGSSKYIKEGSSSGSFTTSTTAVYHTAISYNSLKQSSYYLRYNASKFRYYSSSSQGAGIVFYKLDEGPAYTITAQSNNVAYGTVSLSGKKITASPNTGYTYASLAYTVTSGTATVVQDGNEFTVTPESDCTVRINFAAKQIATITLMEAGTPVAGPSGKYSGETYTLPSSVTNVCDGKTFVGWSTVDIPMPGDKPTENYYGKGAEVTLAATNTFYAVYADAAGGADPVAYTAGDEGSFVLAALNDGKWYALPTNPTVDGGKITGVEISVSQTGGGVNYVTTENATGYTWTIANATNGQTISDGTKNIYHSNGGTSGTNLDYGNSTTLTWSIESEENGLTFKGVNDGTVNSRGMLVSGTTFGGYSLSNEDASGYYRINVLPISGASYSNYTTCGSKYSVTFKNQESVISTTEYTAGTVILAPATAENTCGEGFFFVGWLAQPLYVGATPHTKPAGLIQPNGGITVPAEDVVYYAVFAQKRIN